MSTAPGNDDARRAIASALETLPLPAAPALRDDLWRTHTSLHGALHHQFELPEGEEVTDYERLEHVGDALLGAEVTLLVHELYPRLTAGIRTVVKATLVQNSTLALLSLRFSFPSKLRATYAQASQHRANPSIQACVFEAYLASLYEEHGADKLSDFLREIYSPLVPIAVEALRPHYAATGAGDATPPLNTVGMILEWQKQRGFAAYRTFEWGSPVDTGEADGRWEIQCSVRDTSRPEHAGGATYRGHGTTLAKAKNLAALGACKFVGIA
ncbi:hypothetical protein JCM10207_003499 [Rhodosporidiobolus poonsookiae]